MIFVTIGSLFPFDRMVQLADELAPAIPDETWFAQIGDGKYKPVNIPYARMLPRPEFLKKVDEASVIVAHAGMGSVITAMEKGKPIVLLPRVLEWGEHTTDHQMATARWLADKPGVFVCMDSADFAQTIAAARAAGSTGQTMTRTAPEPFVARIRDFIASV